MIRGRKFESYRGYHEASIDEHGAVYADPLGHTVCGQLLKTSGRRSMSVRYGPDHPDTTYVPHAYPERTFDTGEVVLNYAVTGDESQPALLLTPGQSESWLGYEKAMPLLAKHFQVFGVDLRGQGRSTRTPGRYTFDNLGNDLVRFIAHGIGRPVICSGLSSGGVLSAWLSAYALPRQIRGALYEDPPLFSSETTPAVGQCIKQSIGGMFALWSKTWATSGASVTGRA